MSKAKVPHKAAQSIQRMRALEKVMPCSPEEKAKLISNDWPGFSPWENLLKEEDNYGRQEPTG